jgi:hypothetical protein
MMVNRENFDFFALFLCMFTIYSKAARALVSAVYTILYPLWFQRPGWEAGPSPEKAVCSYAFLTIL